MKNYAIIIDDVIQNVIVWDEESPYQFPANSEILDVTGMLGVGVGCYRTESGWRNPKDDVREEGS
jgi:hypothetical protein